MLERAWDADVEAHFDQHVLLPVDVDLHRVALILSRIQWTTANRHRGDGTGRGLRERMKFGGLLTMLVENNKKIRAAGEASARRRRA